MPRKRTPEPTNEPSLQFNAKAPCYLDPDFGLEIDTNMYGKLEVQGCKACGGGFIKRKPQHEEDKSLFAQLYDVKRQDPELFERIIKAVEDKYPE